MPDRARERVTHRDGGCLLRLGAPLARVMETGPCWGKLDVRKMALSGEHQESNLVCLCRRHSEWADEHPVDARRMGLTR